MAIAWFTDARSADGLSIVNDKTSATHAPTTTTIRETSTKQKLCGMTCHEKKTKFRLKFV